MPSDLPPIVHEFLSCCGWRKVIEKHVVICNRMRAIIQRVSNASVSVSEKVCGAINQGLMILIGIEESDGQEDVDWLTRKIAGLRIFADADGKMNQSVCEINGQVLVVSQFTLHASTKKGTRPSFIRAARPEHAVLSRN